MNKKSCDTCAYCQTDIAQDKQIVSLCYFHPPSVIFMQSAKGAVPVNVPRPVVRPKKDFCHEHLVEPVLHPH